MTSPRDPHSRRGLLIAGVGGLVGTGISAVSAAAAAPAQAASGTALVVGAANTENVAGKGTRLYANSTYSSFTVSNSGAGVAATILATTGKAVFASTGSSAAGAMHARNAGASTGSGVAVRAEGRHNAGILADTLPSVLNVPAIVAIGGDGTGIAQIATGQSYLDGDCLALRNWIGVFDTDNTSLTYASAVSGETSSHSAYGKATLDGTGGAVVTLPATFISAVDMTTLVINLTPVAEAMSGLFATPNSGNDGFTIAGGATSGSAHVYWTAWADRKAVDLSHAQIAAGQVTRASVAVVAARHARVPVALPTRGSTPTV